MGKNKKHKTNYYISIATIVILVLLNVFVYGLVIKVTLDKTNTTYRVGQFNEISKNIYVEDGIDKTAYLTVKKGIELIQPPRYCEISIVTEIPTVLTKDMFEEGLTYVGKYTYDTKEIFIKKHNVDIMLMTTVHEIAHAIDDKKHCSSSVEFMDLYNKYKDTYVACHNQANSEYVTSSKNEFFAGVVVDFLCYPDEFSNQYPDLTEYLMITI